MRRMHENQVEGDRYRNQAKNGTQDEAKVMVVQAIPDVFLIN